MPSSNQIVYTLNGYHEISTPDTKLVIDEPKGETTPMRKKKAF